MGAFAHSDESLRRWDARRANQLGDDGGRTVGLFVNNYTPVPGFDFSDLTECSLSDYARQEAGGADWTQGAVAHVQILTAPNNVVFTTTDTTGQLCYGYFVFYEAEGFAEWAQLFDTPQLLVNGVPISFRPREKLKDCPD